MRGRQRAWILIVSLAAGQACAAAGPEGTLDRLDVAVTVGRDGTVHVEETLVVRFGETPATAFHRFVPTQRHDGLQQITATMDDAPTPPGTGPGTVAVVPGRGIDVRWSFAPVANATRTFRLSYDAVRAVHVSGIRGRLSWQVLPAPRATDAGATHVAVTLPDEAVLLGDPWVEEAGWSVTRRANGMAAQAPAVPRDQSATAGLEFTIDRALMATPRWQYDLERAEEFAPAFVAAALFVLVVGAGVLGMIRLKYSGKAAGSVVEWRAAGRDLRLAAWAVLGLGVAGWAAVALTLQSFGIWPLLVPIAVVLVGVMFLWGGARWSRG